MKLITPEISWHQKEPIFSVHFSPQTWKLATGGADSTVKIWLVKEKEDGDNSIGIEFLANLDRHAKPVNVVRFSPNGSLLASAGDDGTIILWKLNEIEKCSSEFLDDDIVNKENWIVHKMLRGHIEDVYDLAWSPDNTQLISGSVDNSAIIWDTVKGQNQKVITDHNHYVQGVCWDPRSFYVATHSSDRSCRLYATSNYKCLFNIQRNIMSYEKNGQIVKTKYSRMFMDETMQSFFRRCTFSTDGSFLFLPAGLCDGDDKPRKTTYVFARGHYKRPICHLPGSKKATVAVKCSPIVYELMDDKENQIPCKESNEFFKVPYRMVYAVASLDSITLYDTQHNLPIGHCANMHYASLTDITWSSDGKLIVVSSTDGYCSFIKFEEGELGKPIIYDPIEYQITQAKIRKKKKKETKKKELKKSETDRPEDKNAEEVEKISSTLPTETQKEKEKSTPVKPVVDSKQQTIEKLFVTPIRKRKRKTEVSPSGASDIKKSPNTMSPQPLESGTNSNVESITSPVIRKPLSIQKPPKRVQVITLSASNEKLTSNSSNSPVNPQKAVSTNAEKTELNPGNKTPKHVNITNTTLSGPTEKLSKPLMSPNSIHKYVATSTNNEKCPPNPLISPNKTPKRVTVTTLSSNAEKPPLNQLTSPNKLPKRVNVTTLVTFTNSSKTEEISPVTKSVTPSKATYTAVIPPSSPVIHTEKNVTKQPKRITVQTLSTFADVGKSVELEEAESPLTSIPVQVDPPQLDDMISTNSFDEPLIETVLNNSNSEKANVSINIDKSIDLNTSSLNASGSGDSKVEAILID